MPGQKVTKDEMQEALNAHHKHSGSQTRAAKELRISKSCLGRRLAMAKEAGLSVRKRGAAVRKERTGRSLAEFRAQHDKDFIIPARIKEGLKQLGDSWAYEMEFVKLAGVSLGDLGNYREQFAEHVVVVRRDGKRAWAGTTASAAKMREMLS